MRASIQSISLPPELEREAAKLQRENNMSRSELYRAALRTYIAQERRFKELNAYGTRQAKRMGLKGEEAVMRAAVAARRARR